MAKVTMSGFVPPDHPMFHQGAYLVGVNTVKTATNDPVVPANEDPQAQAESTDDSMDEPQPPPLSKEQLRSLLSDFLSSLATSPPPVPSKVVKKQESHGQEEPTEEMTGPTPEELHRGWLEGGKGRLGQMLMRADRKKMVPSPEDLFLAHQKGGRKMLGDLMANMDGDEEGPDPEWNERRWR